MKLKNHLFISILVSVSLQLNAQQIVLDVPYVPTPQDVVDAMLKMADVKKREVVYDLGCGDGRIVITAAKEYGAVGVGVDLNPERIKEANANAIKAEVEDSVKFFVGDLFEFDFSNADVLTLYLLPDVNLQLKPKILEEMKPGSRVVSHAFTMGDWEPDDKLSLDGRNIFMWIVPERE